MPLTSVRTPFDQIAVSALDLLGGPAGSITRALPTLIPRRRPRPMCDARDPAAVIGAERMVAEVLLPLVELLPISPCSSSRMAARRSRHICRASGASRVQSSHLFDDPQRGGAPV